MRCLVCGTIQLSPMPDEAEMVRAYQTEYVAYKQTEECSDQKSSGMFQEHTVQVLFRYWQITG